MDNWNFIIENKILILLIVFIIGLFCALVVFPFLKQSRVNKLIKSVTSLDRGTRSERELILALLKSGVPAQTIFHDLYIKKNRGDFSQIDLVVATTEGIIVFEVKDYSGWIYGSGNNTYWTQVLAFGKQKYRFFNPIIQNNSHIASLRKQLRQFSNIPFYSIIVFYGDCELKEINFVPKGTFLVKSYRILEVLMHIKNNNEAAPYTNKQEIVEVLQQAVNNGESKNIQEKHIENINDMLGKERIFK